MGRWVNRRDTEDTEPKNMKIKDIVGLLVGANLKERERAKKEGRKVKAIRLKGGLTIEASDRVYRVTENGPWVRVSPERPWRGKRERKEVKRRRRMARELALAS